MKTLLANGEHTNINFKNGFTMNLKPINERICDWVNENLKQFSLNEEHSCTATLEDNKIFIHGDEDFMELDIKNLENSVILV